MVTPRLRQVSILRLNGLMLKLYLHVWRMLWLKPNLSRGRWCGRVHRMTLPAIPTDSFPLQLIVLTGNEIQSTSPITLQVEATGLGGRDLSYPIPWDISIRSDKESTDLRLLLWRRRLMFLASLEALKLCRSLH